MKNKKCTAAIHGHATLSMWKTCPYCGEILDKKEKREERMRLVEMNGTEIVKDLRAGDEVTTFRGDKYILTGWREPSNPGSSGHVFVKDEDGEREFYPNVINAKFIQ